MGKDEKKEEDDVVERICQGQVLRKLLNDRFDCSQCTEFKGRRGRMIIRCFEHLEQLKAGLDDSPKNPGE
jgi:hypothetical protein